MVGDCKYDQFYQLKVRAERDGDCAVSLQIAKVPALLFRIQRSN